MMMRILTAAVVGGLFESARAFQSPVSTSTRTTAKRSSVVSSTALSAALTQRQLQFWEDVEDGLDDVERLYGAIPRIRQFGKR